jgi:hypothetical protein
MNRLDLSYHQIRATWDPLLTICVITNINSTNLSLITTLVTDVILLLIMLVGLLRLGFHEPGVYSLGRLMWKQVCVFAASRGVSYPLICSPFARDSFGSSLPPLLRSRQW